MADISMCSGEGCTMRETCYRFKATACEYAQSYFITPPLDGVDEDGNTKCGYYWKHDKIQNRAKAYMSLKRSVVERLTKKEEDETEGL